ncbi:P-loop containing nucleoside triphosphate hydrolase protein [Hymenopellis radicata]|nr:P-loop containing nucleoside triphosphate hydrolase protein [Hymenopellis radicata]
MSVPVTLFYASVLALSALYIQPGWSRVVTRHYNLTVLATFCVYFYRDVFPLMTFTLSIQDPAEGKLLWAKVALLGFIGVVLPLGIPRAYVPVDPNLPPLADFDHSHYLKRTRFPHMDVFSGAPKRHLFWGLLLAFRMEYAHLLLMIELRIVFSFASPISLNRLLAYIETRGEDAFIRPYVWILFLLFGPAKIIVRLQALLTELVFEHSLRIRMKAAVPEESTLDGAASAGNGDESTVQANQAEKEGAKKASQPDSATSNLVGKINNLVSTDLQNVTDARDFFCSSLTSLYKLHSAFCSCTPFLDGGVCSIHYCCYDSAIFTGSQRVRRSGHLDSHDSDSGLIAKLTHTVQENRLKKADARVQSVTEIMNVLRMVKLFGWETRMDEHITSKRENEMIWIKYRQLLDLLNEVVNGAKQSNSPFSVLVFVLSSDYHRDERKAYSLIVFSSMAVFEMLQQQLHEIFNLITTSIAGKVSVDRLNDFLKDTELIDSFAGDATTGGNLCIPAGGNVVSTMIGFQNTSFTWSSDAGRLNLIVGPTGSGKTSLLMALLGEMHFIPIGSEPWYNLPRAKGIAYAAQESWVQNETIKANIIFGAPFDESRYKKVVYQCGLDRDISLFDAGDETEVGEKGLTLSGGQKARVTLARAIYSTADIILLDDVLAALDVHTAKWIVEKCFAGDLVKGRTIILVTHNVALTQPLADFVVSVKDGRISAQGSALDVLGKTESLKDEATKDEQSLVKGAQEIDGPADKKASGKLIVAEEMEEGHVGWPGLQLYFTALGGNHVWMYFLSVIGGFALVEMFNVSQTWWIGYWASQSLHHQLMQSILGTTLRWFDTTPTSRVIARCTQDIQAVDGPVAMWFQFLLNASMTLIVKLCAIVIVTPVFLVPSAAVYMKAQLSVKRQMANAKAPVLAHFGAAIAGLMQEAFINESLRRIDRYTRASRVFIDLGRWISLRIDSLGVYLLLPWPLICGLIMWWVRTLNMFEVQGNSLERIQQAKATNQGEPPAYWPAAVIYGYSLDGPKVLHDVSFHIKSGERVGVVGRTGSGKSSLTLSLLRCIFTEGNVYYDGLSTSSVNLDALRTSITIIPQMPELLSGSLRQNLDPFDQYDDASLNDALEPPAYSLQDETEEGRVTLDSTISTTSAIDYKTDSIIQSSLRHELKGDVTLITVAHRLQTSWMRIKLWMVLDAGNLVEFDSPAQLLKNEKGFLRALVDESNDKATLYAMAEGRHA